MLSQYTPRLLMLLFLCVSGALWIVACSEGQPFCFDTDDCPPSSKCKGRMCVLVGKGEGLADALESTDAQTEQFTEAKEPFLDSKVPCRDLDDSQVSVGDGWVVSVDAPDGDHPVGFDVAWTVAVDDCGFIYAGGQMMPGASLGPRLRNPYQQAQLFLAKFARDGKLLGHWLPSSLGNANRNSLSMLTRIVLRGDTLSLLGQYRGALSFSSVNRLPPPHVGSHSWGFDLFLATYPLRHFEQKQPVFEGLHVVGGPGLDWSQNVLFDSSGMTHLLGTFTGMKLFANQGETLLAFDGKSTQTNTFYLLGKEGAYTHGRVFSSLRVANMFVESTPGVLLAGSFSSTQTVDGCSFRLGTGQHSALFLARFVPSKTSSSMICHERLLPFFSGKESELVKVVRFDSEHILLVGRVSGDLVWNGSVLIRNKLGSRSAFLLKYAIHSQKVVWFGKIDGDRTIDVNSAVVSRDGDVYLAGSFDKHAVFDPDGRDHTLRSRGDHADGFVAKWSASGRFVWALRTGGKGVTSSGQKGGVVNQIVLDKEGHLFAVGWVHGEAELALGWRGDAPIYSRNRSFSPTGRLQLQGRTGAFIWKVPNRD
jgi:hypothetical protein